MIASKINICMEVSMDFIPRKAFHGLVNLIYLTGMGIAVWEYADVVKCEKVVLSLSLPSISGSWEGILPPYRLLICIRAVHKNEGSQNIFI